MNTTDQEVTSGISGVYGIARGLEASDFQVDRVSLSIGYVVPLRGLNRHAVM